MVVERPTGIANPAAVLCAGPARLVRPIVHGSGSRASTEPVAANGTTLGSTRRPAATLGSRMSADRDSAQTGDPYDPGSQRTPIRTGPQNYRPEPQRASTSRR